VKKYFSAEKLEPIHEEEARVAALYVLKHYLKDSEKLRLPK